MMPTAEVFQEGAGETSAIGELTQPAAEAPGVGLSDVAEAPGVEGPSPSPATWEITPPSGWPEAHRAPGMPAKFPAEEQAQVDQAGSQAFRSLGVDRAFLRLYTEAAFWRMSSGRWEAKCASWAELATARGDEVGRLRERLETVELVFKSLEQTTADQQHSLDVHWKNYAAVKADCEALRKDLGEARVEPDALRAELEASKRELAKARAEPDALRVELSDSQAELEVLKAELADARAASGALEKGLEEARIESDASKAESAGLRSELEASEKELDNLRAVAQSRVEALIQEKADLVADSVAALGQRDEEVREAKLETAEAREAARAQSEALHLELQELRDRLDRAVVDYKASEAFDDVLAEAGSYSYDVGFADGLRQVKRAYPAVDVSEIKVPPGDQSDDDADVAGAGGLTDDRVGTVEVVDVSEEDTPE